MKNLKPSDMKENINEDRAKNVYGVSCLSRYKQTSKRISIALGFKEPYDGQSALGRYKHLINFSDVQNVAEWFFENGYDIVKLKTK